MQINKVSNFKGVLVIRGVKIEFNIKSEKQNMLTYKWGSWRFQNEARFRDIKDPVIGARAAEGLIEKIKSAVTHSLEFGTTS